MRRIQIQFDMRQIRLLSAFLLSTSIAGFAAGQHIGHSAHQSEIGAAHSMQQPSARTSQQQHPAQNQQRTSSHVAASADLALHHLYVRIPVTASAAFSPAAASGPTPAPTVVTTPRATATPSATPKAKQSSAPESNQKHGKVPRAGHPGKNDGHGKEHHDPKATSRKDSGTPKHGVRPPASAAGATRSPQGQGASAQPPKAPQSNDGTDGRSPHGQPTHGKDK